MANMMNIDENCFRISAWNINGLEYKSHGVKSNKLHDQEVCRILKQSDCIGLLETHAETKQILIYQGTMFFVRTDQRIEKLGNLPEV